MPPSHCPHRIARSQHLSPSCRKRADIYFPCLLCLGIQRCSLGDLPEKMTLVSYKTSGDGCVTNMRRNLGLQSLQNRRKQQDWHSSSSQRADPRNPCKWVLDTHKFRMTAIKPWNPTDFKTTNIVIDHARNNSQSYTVDPRKTAIDRYSFFPAPRTTIDWNNL